MKKREFKPNTVERHLEKDFQLGQDITVELWQDPSRRVITDLFEILGASDSLAEKTEADKEKMNRRYFECASMILIDCDVKGIDFSTAKSTEKAFDDERLPWGIFHQTMVMYIAELTEEYEVLKNALRRVRALSDSGNEAKNEAEEK